MKSVRLSNTTWKWSVAAFALLAVILLANELFFAFKPLTSRSQGALGAQFEWHGENAKDRTIIAIDGGSPLLSYGAAPGDIVTFDKTENKYGSFAVDEPIALTLTHSGVARRLVVKTIAVPITLSMFWARISDYVISLCAVLFATLIAFKQQESKALRSLALYFLCIAFDFDTVFSPPGLLQSLAQLMWAITLFPYLYFLVGFAVNYPADHPTGLRGRLNRCMPLLGSCTATATLYAAWSFSGHSAPMLWSVIEPVFFITLPIMTLIALWDGRRSSAAMSRQRYTWLLLSIGVIAFFTFLLGLALVFPLRKLTGLLVMAQIQSVALLLSYFVILYAVWKHRIFNFGFVVNRALFYTVTSLMLLVAFGIVEWLSEHFLHFEAREANALIDGGIALAVYLVFHRLRHGVEHWLERIFFHKWHANEARLRQFIKKAAHITTVDALLHDFHAELTRFSGGATCSIFMRGADGSYVPTTINRVDQPFDPVDENDEICILFRTESVPMLVNDDHPVHAGELALPISHRGNVHGFVILNAKPNGETYRPDEIEILGFATNQIGLDLLALRTDKLEAKVEEQTLIAEGERAKVRELQTAFAQLAARIEHLPA